MTTPFPDLRDLPRLYKESDKTTKIFFKNLRGRRPHDLDAVTHELNELVWDHIDCLDCGNCCSKLPALVKFKDVRPLAIALNLGDAEFMDTYTKGDKDDGEMIFKSLPCPFLEDDKCCSVYDQRPKSCTEYPHTDAKRIIKRLSFMQRDAEICPAVWWIIEELKVHYKDRYK